MITLRFVSHPGVFNWACRIAQYGFWPTHVEALMPDGTLLGAMGDGVKARSRYYDVDGFSDAPNFTREMLIEVAATAEQEEAFHSFLRGQVGKPYDTWAIVSFYSKRSSGRDWQADDSWFCSELIGAALAGCGKFPQHMAVEFSRVTVRDVMLLVSTLTGVGNNER